MKNLTKHSKIIIIISLLIILLIIIYRIYPIKSNIKYYKHPNKILGIIQAEIYKEYNFNQRNKNWNLYVPNGYNNIEKELLTIPQSNKHRYIFGINNCDLFCSKNGLWSIHLNKYGYTKTCTILPKTYILYNKNDINRFKTDFNPYDTYIMKKNIQRKEGLKITNNLNEILNGYKNNYKIVQMYLKDIFLVNSRKLNIRIYILIVYNKTPKFYLYNKGKCIYTNKDYNGNIHDIESNITSYNMNYDIYKTNPYYIEDLNKYIYNNYNIKIDILLKIINLMTLTCNVIKNNLFKSNNIKNDTTFQLFGVDIILDKKLNPYLLEFNKGPDMLIRCKNDYSIKKELNIDIYSLLNLIKINKKNNFIEII